jgi:hypothetical protein
MSFLIKIFGAAATLLFALMLLRGYKYFLKKRKEEREEFLVLFDAVRDGVGCFLSPLSSIFSRFCEGDSTLARISRRIKDGESPKSAYNAEERGFHIGEAGREMLSRNRLPANAPASILTTPTGASKSVSVRPTG